ncbi:MAG: hypothetical protein HY787_04630 [Deltaproteobacteria bacterium]|nr:hypothetical protein [Deltaproteobacteria bacterium]
MVAYATPEWLEEVARIYRADPSNEVLKRLEKLTFCYRIHAEPAVGIDNDIYFIMGVDDGVLKELRFVSRTEGEQAANWVLAAKFDQWKRIIQKKDKFITTVVQGKVSVETGDKAELIGRVSPSADQLVFNFFKAETIWPDEMSPEELLSYKTNMSNFRKKLGI